MDNQPGKPSIIKNIYLYLVSFVSLMMVVFSVADIINLGLKTYVFTKADQNFYGPAAICPAVPAPVGTSGKTIPPPDCTVETAAARQQAADNLTAQRQRDLVRDISFIIVGIPLFAYHCRIIRRKEA